MPEPHYLTPKKSIHQASSNIPLENKDSWIPGSVSDSCKFFIDARTELVSKNLSFAKAPSTNKAH